MTRLLALDVGEARIGVAVSDPSGFLASPYTTLHVSADELRTWTAIQRLISETQAEGLVIGLPISLDGQIHAQGERIQAFAERLQQHVTIPLSCWDERLSTVEAQRRLSDQDEEPKRQKRGRHPIYRVRNTQRRSSARRRRKRPAQGIDAIAATIILQEFLDHLRNKEKNNEKTRNT